MKLEGRINNRFLGVKGLSVGTCALLMSHYEFSLNSFIFSIKLAWRILDQSGVSLKACCGFFNNIISYIDQMF